MSGHAGRKTSSTMVDEHRRARRRQHHRAHELRWYNSVTGSNWCFEGSVVTHFNDLHSGVNTDIAARFRRAIETPSSAPPSGFEFIGVPSAMTAWSIRRSARRADQPRDTGREETVVPSAARSSMTSHAKTASWVEASGGFIKEQH